MAANLQGKRAIGLGKRLKNQIWAVAAASRDLPPATSAVARRAGVHTSAYDKNTDEQVCPSPVPDDVIQSQSDKFWGPHPTTGVFGPADSNRHPDPAAAASPGTGTSSALDQTAWFRPVDGVEQPHNA